MSKMMYKNVAHVYILYYFEHLSRTVIFKITHYYFLFCVLETTEMEVLNLWGYMEGTNLLLSFQVYYIVIVFT